MWVPGNNPRSTARAVNTPNHWTISLACKYILVEDYLWFLACNDADNFVVFCCCFCFVFGWFWFFCFQDKTWFLCGPGYPGTHSVDQGGIKVRDFPASTSGMLGLKVCARMPHLAQGSHHCPLSSISNQEKCHRTPTATPVTAYTQSIWWKQFLFLPSRFWD